MSGLYAFVSVFLAVYPVDNGAIRLHAFIYDGMEHQGLTYEHCIEVKEQISRDFGNHENDFCMDQKLANQIVTVK